jgi:hypothetical protein
MENGMKLFFLLSAFSTFLFGSALSMSQFVEQVIYQNQNGQISVEFDPRSAAPLETLDGLIGEKIKTPNDEDEKYISICLNQLLKNPIGNVVLSRIVSDSRIINIMFGDAKTSLEKINENLQSSHAKNVEERQNLLLAAFASGEIVNAEHPLTTQETCQLSIDYWNADKCIYASSREYYVLVDARTTSDDVFICLADFSLPIPRPITIKKHVRQVQERVLHEILHTGQRDKLGPLADFGGQLSEMKLFGVDDLLSKNIIAFSRFCDSRSEVTPYIFKDAFSNDREFLVITGFYMKGDKFMFTPFSEWGYQMFQYKNAEIRSAHNIVDFGLYRKKFSQDFPKESIIHISRYTNLNEVKNFEEMQQCMYNELFLLYRLFLECWNTKIVQNHICGL